MAYLLTALVLAFCFFVAPANSQVRPRPPVAINPRLLPPPSMNSSAEIPNGKIPSIEREALAGNPQSAMKLALYYALILDSQNKYNYWIKIAAENGSPIGEYNLGSYLARTGDAKDLSRAIYWLKKAKAGGNTGCEGSAGYPGCVGLLQLLEGRQAGIGRAE